MAAGLRFLGRGVAYELRAPELVGLRGRLARGWQDWLTPQDAQGYRPHVTIQNKAAPEAARALRDAMQAGFAPFTVRAEGLLLWHYLGGPWELAGGAPVRGRLIHRRGPGRHAAVDDDGLPRHEAPRRGGQEHGGAGDLVRLADALQRGVAGAAA